MFASANAGADGGEANGVTGRDRTRSGGKYAGLQDCFGDRGGGESASAEVNELTTGQGIFRHGGPPSLNFRIASAATQARSDDSEELLHRRGHASKNDFLVSLGKSHLGPSLHNPLLETDLRLCILSVRGCSLRLTC